MNSECMCTFIVILFNCDELWLCNHPVLVMMSFFYFKNLLVETRMLMSTCPLLQFCTVVTGGGMAVSTVGGHCNDVISTSVALPVATVTLCPFL
jgi:hypothetical protein